MRGWKKLVAVVAGPALVAGTFLAVSYKRHSDKLKKGFRWE